MQGFGILMARLGGADPDVLARAKQISKAGASKDQARFVALGLVMLATACLAVLSMTFAMTDGLHVGLRGAVLVGLFWGVVILIVDRALILSLKPKGSRWLLFWMILPRIGMAALLGLVISTPLTLRIFNDEIKHQMTRTNIDKAEAASATLSNGDRQKKLDALKKDIDKYEGYLSGNVPVTSTDVVSLEGELTTAKADYEAKEKSANTAWRVWRCELEGKLCDAGSGKVGNGPRAKAMKRDYDRKQGEADAAEELVATKQAAVTAAQDQSREDNADKVAKAQAEANRVLPGLRTQRDELQAAIDNDLGTSNKTAADDTGLLARLVALSDLGEDNTWARLAHLLVAALLFMLELLPVAVKSLSILGPPTAYDQIDELDTKEVVRAAGRHEYIDKDLEKRKKRIAEAVHKEVEDVMRDLALLQVRQWKQQVAQMTVPQPPPPPGSPQTNGVSPTSPVNGGPPIYVAPPQPANGFPVNGGQSAPVPSPAASGGPAGVPSPRSAAEKAAVALNLPPSKRFKL